MIKKIITILTFVLLYNIYASGQSFDANAHYVMYRVVNGDTILLAFIDEVNIAAKRRFKNKFDERRYWKLVYNLKKVYPYAKLARVKLQEMNAHFLTLKTEKQKKAYTKQMEKEIRDQFEDELKKLTITQGRLLIKLIDRETGNTSYELVKELRGTFSAVFWQTLARLFGSNLKTEYDAKGDDRLIEDILLAIDAGYL
jgi:hypothetical protein